MAFTLYLTISVAMHRLFLSGATDLGIFTQAMDGIVRGQGPQVAIKAQAGYNVFGDHWHPLILVVVPIYAVWQSPLSLLVVQAAAAAATVAIVAWLARDLLPARLARAVSIAAVLSWGVVQGVAFDFHEVILGLPLAAMAMRALLLHRTLACSLWAGAYLFTKEDAFLLVVPIALVLMLRRERVGLWLSLIAVLYSFLAVRFIIPFFNPDGVYSYLASGADIHVLFTGVFTKLGTILLLLLPTLGLPLRSPLCLVLVPGLLARFMSDRPGSWGLEFHYNATPCVILWLIAVSVLARSPTMSPRVAKSLAGSFAAVALLILPATRLGMVGRDGLWRCEDCAWVPELIETLPPSGAVAVPNHVLPHVPGIGRASLVTPDFTDGLGAPLRAPAVLIDLRENGMEDLEQRLTARGYTVQRTLGPFVLLHAPQQR